MISLEQRLSNYLEKIYPSWISKGELEDIVTKNTKYMAETSGRKLRILHEKGIIEKREQNHHCFYRFKKEDIVIDKFWKEITS